MPFEFTSVPSPYLERLLTTILLNIVDRKTALQLLGDR